MRRNTQRALALLVLLAGCAGPAMDVQRLEAEGYRRLDLTMVTPAGARIPSERYEVWVREDRNGGRVVRLCLVPKLGVDDYNWRVTVSVNARETWSYDSGVTGRASTYRRGVDCVNSPALPEGRLSWRTSFVYR